LLAGQDNIFKKLKTMYIFLNLAGQFHIQIRNYLQFSNIKRNNIILL